MDVAGAVEAAAKRIRRALVARATGLLPEDFDQVLEQDVDEMQARYRELRGKLGFSEAARVSEEEFLQSVLTGLVNGAGEHQSSRSV